MKNFIHAALVAVMIGAFMAIGMRAVEWTIPQPEIRVIICAATDTGKIEDCESAAEILAKKKREAA